MEVRITCAVVYTVVIVLSLRLAGGVLHAEPYDPLRIPEAFEVKTIEFTVEDKARDRRIPIRVYLPASTGPSPVVLFSHGLGGTRNGCKYLGKHWSARGYVVVCPQHLGSDDGVWRDLRLGQRIVAMRRAASAENLKLRIGDIHRVLDELNIWNSQGGHSLAHRQNLEQVGMSGHSFGAITAQAVGGQKLVEDGDVHDPRIRAVVALSPSSPRVGDPATAFASVSIPWLMMTGTKDVVKMFNTDLESRLGVYRNLPVENDRYELVLHEAEHSAFTDVRMAWDRGERNPNHHRAILAISTAFWDFYLLGNAEAGTWLHGERVRSVLEEEDAWQWAAAGSPVKQPEQVGSDEDLQPVGPQSDKHE